MKIIELISEVKIPQSSNVIPSIPKIPTAPTATKAPTAPATATTPAKPTAGSGSATLGNKSAGAATIPSSPTPASTTTPPKTTQPASTIPPVGQSAIGDDEPDQDLQSGPRGIMGGIKAGLGMNPDQSFAQGLATKTLQATGMSNTAAELNPMGSQQQISSTGGRFDPATQSQYKIGGTIKHPELGDLPIRKVTPYGVTVTSQKIGHDVRLSPQALAAIQARMAPKR